MYECLKNHKSRGVIFNPPCPWWPLLEHKISRIKCSFDNSPLCSIAGHVICECPLKQSIEWFDSDQIRSKDHYSKDLDLISDQYSISWSWSDLRSFFNMIWSKMIWNFQIINMQTKRGKYGLLFSESGNFTQKRIVLSEFWY